MSTWAPWKGKQEGMWILLPAGTVVVILLLELLLTLLFILYTWITNCNGIPCCTVPSEGSDVILERLGTPATKYGPSICWGEPSCSTNEGVSTQVLLVEEAIWSGDSWSEERGGDGGYGNGFGDCGIWELKDDDVGGGISEFVFCAKTDDSEIVKLILIINDKRVNKIMPHSSKTLILLCMSS